MMSDVSDSRRRLLQFSLRSLLLVILLVAVFLGGRATMQPAIEAERARALAAEEKARALTESREQQALQLRATTLKMLQGLESLDPAEAMNRRKLELDRLRDVIERHETEQRTQKALEHAAR